MGNRTNAAALVLVLLAGTAAAGAAGWTIEPVLTVTGEHTDNVRTIGAGGASDTIVSTALLLPLRRETPRTTLELSWQPSRETYNDYGALDNTAHTVRLAWRHEPTRRTTWNLSAGWDRRERARVRYDDVADDLVVLPHTRVDTLSGRLEGRFTLAPRSRLTTAATWRDTSYDEPRVPAAGGLPVRLADSTDTALSVGFERDVGRRTALRVRWQGSRIDEGFRGEWDVHRALVGLVLGHAERLQWTLEAGAAWTDVRDPGETGADDSPTWGVGTIGIRGPVGRRSGTLVAGAGVDVAGSGGTSGVSRSTFGYVGWRMPVGRWSQVEIVGRYAERDPLDPAYVRTITRSWRAEWRASFSPRFALVFAGEILNQSASGTVLAADTTTWSIGMRWDPLAPRR